MEMQVAAERRKREEILQNEGDQQSEISSSRRKPQDCDSVEQQSSAQDPGAHSQPKLEGVTSKESFDKVKIRLSEIKSMSPTVSTKTVKTTRGEGVQQVRS